MQLPLDQLKMMQLHDRILRESSSKEPNTSGAAAGENNVKLPDLAIKSKSIQSFESTQKSGKRSPGMKAKIADSSMGTHGITSNQY